MMINLMKGKIHRARVTEAKLEYMGSITIDRDLLDAAGMVPGERVQIVNNNTGARLETYTIEGERGKGEVCLNGGAARLVYPGDEVIIIAYGWFDEEEAKTFEPKVVFVDQNNRIMTLGKETANTVSL